jgi:hypothetical protein
MYRKTITSAGPADSIQKRTSDRGLRTAVFLALAAVIVCPPAPARAQQLNRDSVWNGVVTGAAIGAGLGLVVAKKGADICSAPDCMYLGAVAGGAIGRLADRLVGKPAPVRPGQWIDDSRWNGALIGAGAGSAVVLIDRARHCGKGPGRVQCTAGGTFGELWRAALFNAGVGAVIDSAIPKRAPARRADSTGETSRGFALSVDLRF